MQKCIGLNSGQKIRENRLEESRFEKIDLKNRSEKSESRPGILYGLCKVHKDITDVFASFTPILSAIGAPSYKLAKF